MRSYLPFIAAHPRFLLFGFLATFFSSFGQTFYISLFGGELRAAFDLSHGDFGALYSGATLASGLTLIWLGRMIDRVALRHYTLFVCAALAAACLFMGLVPGALTLALAFFALRLTGQGLLSHLAMVVMGRHFSAGRGKAISLAALGHPAGEAVFPAIAVALIGALGWRGAWLAAGAVLLVTLAPLMVTLIRGAPAPASEATTANPADAHASRAGDRSASEVVRDPLFYVVSICTLSPGFILTGLFFHQVALAGSKGWSLSWLAACFIVFAAAQMTSGLGTGSLVDRLGTIRVLPVYLLPLAAAAAVLGAFDDPLAAAVYLGLAGLTAGGGFTVLGALWAEVYGVTHLGAIRGVVQALMVLATAAAPVLFGWLLDEGVSFDAIAFGCAAYAAGASGLLTLMRGRLRSRSVA